MTTTMTTTTALRRVDKARQMLDFIDDPLDPRALVGDRPRPGSAAAVPPERDALANLVRCVVRAADGRKAESIVALRVSAVTTVTSFMVIVTGKNKPQNQAIAAAVKRDVEDAFGGMLPGSTGVPEGTADSGWTVLDYGSVMVHVMTPKSRLFYNIEGQWRDKGGEYMDLQDVVLPNSVPSGTSQSLQQQPMQEEKQVSGVGRMEELSQEEDPFWS